MEVTLNKDAPKPELVALIGADGKGIFLRHSLGGSCFISVEASVNNRTTKALEDLLLDNKGRTPVYRGDSITLTF